MSNAGLDPRNVSIHRKGSGAPLVLLHCLGVDHRLWDIAAAGLERDFTLVSYDFPGHGETALSPRGYGVEDLSAQLAALFEREGIARAHVGGISLGGLVAQHFAATYPERVDRLMLLDTTPRYTDEMRQMWVVRASGAHAGGGVAARQPAAGLVYARVHRRRSLGGALCTRMLPWRYRRRLRTGLRGAGRRRSAPAGGQNIGSDSGGLRRSGKRSVPGCGALADRKH